MRRGSRVRKRKGAEGEERAEKGEGGLEFDICPPPRRVPGYATGSTTATAEFRNKSFKTHTQTVKTKKEVMNTQRHKKTLAVII